MRGIRPAISKYIRAWPIFIFPLVLSGATTAFAVELIHSFDSTVRVAKDGELTVTEAIRVEADGREIRHGIYRDFPLTFKDAGGTVREVDFKLLGVERDGRPEKYSTTRQHGVVRIYAGSKDLDVPRGEHTYVFRYRTGRQVRWFDGKPELNWNVTGNFWRFPIFQANYNLELADGARPLRWTAYTGRLGARGGNWRATIDTSGALMVATTRPLAPGEGLTVVAELPSDAVDPLSESQLLRYRLYDNRAWIFAGVGLLVVFGYYFVAWRVVGRDPKGGVVIPLFHPPPNISPALANYIHDWGFGRDKWRAFTAAALSLAVRELLRFDDSSGTLALKATGKKAPGRLPVGERSVLDWVNGQGGLAIISDAHGASIAKVGDSFTKSIERENRNRFFRRNLGYVIAGLAMTAAAIGGVLVFGGLQDQDLAVLGGFVFFGFISGMFLVHLLQMFFAGVSLNGLIRGAMSIVFLAIFISIANSLLKEWSPSALVDSLPAVWAYVENYPFSFVLVGAFAMVNGLFFYLLRAPTVLGRPIMDQLAGLRLYLQTAESDRLNMNAPEITAERFEALLPYAVALDVEKPWSDAFASALRRAHPDDADPMSHYRSGWSSGSWSSSNFSSAVSSSISGVSSALASSVPVSSGSSGFSGGGGSGGGGGGGGGGGW
ncbi:MAG: DUF2207 domain-containing protein [Pseudolabrys sp.]